MTHPVVKELFAKTSLPWIAEKTILMVRAGSWMYGLNTETSDLDVRGIAIPPKEYFFGFNKKFEQNDKFGDSVIDAVIFDIRKFIQLASECNPSVLEILFCDPVDHLYLTEAGRKLLDSRHLFLSKRARFRYMGYAVSQFNRIKLHRNYLLNPVEVAPTREQFGLPSFTEIPKDQLSAVQAEVAKQLDRWNDDPGLELIESTKIALREHISLYLAELQISQEDRFGAAARKLGMEENFIALLQKERAYKAAVDQFTKYLDWKKNRNPKRAAMEAKFGFDGKHAMHLVRLTLQCEELLQTGVLKVKRDDREYLLGIKNGNISFDSLQEWFNQKSVEIDELYKSCTILPHTPDINKIDQLCIDLVEASLR
jgi:predicted nucleotidyltransferase